MNKKYDEIIKEIDKYKSKDSSFESGKIIGSMCVHPHKIAKEVFIKFLGTNIGDPSLFPGTNEIESHYLTFVSKLLNAPKNFGGQIVSGGTEGNITAMWMAKILTGKREIIIPESAHFSFNKISSLMDMKLVNIPLNDNYILDISKVKNKINSNTAAILGIAGSTELGTIDPIPDLSDICLDENLFLHVDAAFGGFVIPFLKKMGYKIFDFDFKLKGVSSISIDAHKMGCSLIPLGSIIFRDKNWIENISVESHCISTEKQAGILGTRPGAPIAAGYAVARYLGMEGYKRVVRDCMTVTKYTKQKICDMGLKLVTNPTMNVIGVKLNNISKVFDQLTKHGWRVNKIERLNCIRIVLMPQISKSIIDDFIPDLYKVCRETGEI